MLKAIIRRLSPWPYSQAVDLFQCACLLWAGCRKGKIFACVVLLPTVAVFLYYLRGLRPCTFQTSFRYSQR